MKKFFEVFSNFLLILNPIAGMLIVGSCILGQWYWMFPIIFIVFINFKFYFWAHKEEFENYEKWKTEITRGYTYMGTDEYSDCEYWKNDLTKEIIEL